MTQTPFPEPVSPPPRRNRRWRKLLLIFSLLAVAGIGSGAWWLWIFIHEKLAPLVAENLGHEIDRPVQLGKLERISLNSLRFGASALPATATDPNRATIDAVDVQFDPWQVLLQQRLALYVTLIKPTAYVEQNQQGLWITTKLNPPPGKSAIEVQLAQLRFADAKVELLGQAKPGKPRKSVQLQQINGNLDIFDSNRRFSYELKGHSAAKGQFHIRGESQRVTDQDLLSKLNLESTDFLVAEIDRLIRLPVDIKAGRVDGKVDITLNPDLTFNLLGKAKLKQVTLTAPGAPQPINQANGDIELENQTVRLKNVKAKFGLLPFVASGLIDPQKGFDLTANLANIEIPQFIKTFQLKTPVPVTGNAQAQIVMKGPIATPIITGTVENIGFITVDRLAIDQVKHRFRLDSAAKTLAIADLTVSPKVGGRVTGGGTIGLDNPQTVNFALQVKAVPGDAIAKIYHPQALPFKIGGVNAQVNVKGNAENPITTAVWSTSQGTYAATGEVLIADGGKRIDLRRFVSPMYGGIVTATGQLRDRAFQGNVAIGPVQLAQFNPQLAGNAQGRAIIRGQLSDTGVAGLIVDATGTAQTFGGTIAATGQLNDRTWQADVNLGGIQLAQADRSLRGAAAGQVKLRGRLDQLTAKGITADGQIRLSEGIALINKPIAAQFNWDGRQINLKSATAQGLQASGTIFAKVEGTPAITGLDLQVKTTGLTLAALPIDLPEGVDVTGVANFTGRVSGTPTQPVVKGQLGLFDFGVNGIAFEPLQGSVDLSQGVKLNLAGQHDRIALQLNAQNQPIAVNIQRGKIQIAGQAQGELFNVALRDLPLNELSSLGLQIPNLAGKLSGNASINLARLELPSAVITIEQPQVGQFPNLFQGQKIQANVSYVNGIGKGHIAVNRPRLGTIESGDAVTNFVYANNIFRISDFTIQKGDSQFAIAGALDLRSPRPKLIGDIKIKQGKIEDILGALQVFELGDFGRIASSPSYATANSIGNISVGAPSQSNVSLQTQLERLAEINTQIRQITRSRKELIKPVPGEDRTENLLPQMADVRGVFDSKIHFSTNFQTIDVDEFEVAAQKLEWRPFPSYVEFQKMGGKTTVKRRDNKVLEAQSVIISATYKDGQLDLTRASAQIDDAQLNLQLNYGGKNTSGQLSLSKLPIAKIRQFYPFPLDLNGELNATASLGGTRESPNAGGQINLKEGTLNGNQIASASSFFNYQKGRLNLDTTVKIDNPEPLKITGEIPLPIPFINVFPENDNIDLNINVKDQGLALLNLFNTPLTWKDGKGQINLAIGGKLLNPTANGEISLQNASFLAQGLPEALTNVNGTIRFDQDRIRVEGLKGDFSRGYVAAKGSLPLFNLFGSLPSDAAPSGGCLSEDINQPLSVEMSRIKLSYKGLYQGNVKGCLNVAGNLVSPKISGEITLSQGQVLLSDELTQPATPTPGQSPGSSSGNSPSPASANPAGLEFDNLRLTLGNDIQILRAPIINFVAEGTLTLNGNLNAPRPVGPIVLRAGQVNLFTTQFVLARGYSHTATFNQGLDPILDVRMIASVPEVTRSPINASQAITSEVNASPLFATNLGLLETVRIQAKVSGPASQLFDNLELTSSPNRSQNEIIALLGGGFINTLGRGDSTLGIANLAGSALLTNIQGFIGNALGLSDFRLFPTISTDADKRTSTLGLAAEIGVDITPGISASVSKVLTSKKFPQLGLRYRINEHVLFRGSTDFFGDNQAVVEYETRF